MKNYTKDELLEAIKDSGGIVSEIARRLRCDWMTARKYTESSKTTREAMIAESEAMLDQVERSAYDTALAGDGKMIRYILSTKGRRRGWCEDDIAQVAADPIVQIIFPCEAGEPDED